MPDAQAGQFVVLPQENKFIFSKGNKSEVEWASDIIDYLNRNYKVFKCLSTKGKDIELDTEVLAEWIKNYYENKKNTKFFITSFDNKMVISPTDKIDKYFEISACLRIKKSGSGDPSNNNISELCMILGKCAKEFKKNGKKWFVNFNNPESEKFILAGPSYRYQFSKVGASSFNIRRLSNTNNANVVFSLHSKKEQDPEDLTIFRKAILE